MSEESRKITFRDIFGTTTMATTASIVGALMSSFFLLYLTDYSGIGTYAAALGSGVMIAARCLDVVIDPTVGMIITRKQPGRFGKYRPFMLINLLLSTVTVIALFFIPTVILNSKIAVIVYVLVFYLLYDIACSFNTPELMYRTIAKDPNERGKLLIGPKFLSILTGIFVAALITVVSKVGDAVGSVHTGFGLTVALYAVVALVVSLIGLACVKEYFHADAAKEKKAKQKITLKDYAIVFKENEAFRVKTISGIFSGFVWTLVFNCCTYYCKWTYCANLTTGEVDTAKFGVFTIVSSMVTLIPMLTGVSLSQPLMKRIGKPDRFYRILLIAQMIPCGLLFLLHITGLLAMTPIFFYVPIATISLAMGASNVPGSVLNMESMDYDIYKNHTDRSAIMNSLSSLIGKIQSSVTSVAIASVLVAIGYVVDSETDTFIGDLSKIPSMMNWFSVIMGLIPFLFLLIAYLLLRHYPVTDEMREKF